MMPSVQHYIFLSTILFCVGVTGVICRRNILIIFMSLELMLNACNLLFITFARMHGGLDGQVITFFVMALAAAEVAIGLGILIAVYKKRGTVDIGEIRFLKG